MTEEHTEISKAVSHALRHEPWLYELELDAEGWVDVDALLRALRNIRAEWTHLSTADLAEVIGSSPKKRHELIDGKVRALYGHSLPGLISKKEALPPETLFHGTSPAALNAIRDGGLLPMGRQYVHLSPNLDVARAVGLRKSRSPQILSIDTRSAIEGGVCFYYGNEHVWLSGAIPHNFIEVD